MNTIYVITNHVNGKQYVGKTCKLLEYRFREHQQCSKQAWLCERPLYHAIRKYGKGSFSIEAQEEVDDAHVDEREIYWIDRLGTYGVYNATKGGEGYRQQDDIEIARLYREYGSIVEVRKKTGHAPMAISKCLRKAGIEIETTQAKNRRLYSKSIYAIDAEGKRYCFSSRIEAAKWVIALTGKNATPRTVSAHICDAANGIYKSAYGYVWKNGNLDRRDDKSTDEG